MRTKKADCACGGKHHAKGFCKKCYFKNRESDPRVLALNREKAARYRARHPERARASVRKWQSENPEQLKASVKASVDKRYATDAVFRMAQQLRNRMRDAFHKQGLIKNTKTLDILGCNSFELRDYLSSKFRTGMTLDNYGSVWNMDHIIPCSRFDLSREDHVRACFHYTNLQPLFIKENLMKCNGDNSVNWSELIRCQINLSKGLTNV